MAFDVSALPNYVEQNRLPLLSKAQFGADSVKYLNVMTGVKNVSDLNIIATDAVLANRACGWNPSGTTSFTKRQMIVKRAQVEMALCAHDLETKWMNEQTKTAAGAEVLPFEEQITDGINKSINKQVENLIWNASLATDGFDGLKTIMSGIPAQAVSVESGATVYDKVLALYKAIPVEVLDKAEIFMGIADFRALVLEITAKNLYHYDPKVEDPMTITLPGTSTAVHGVSGLNGTSFMLAADPENLFYGCDMQDDKETYKLWFSEDNDEFRVRINLNVGAQIAFPDQVVYVG